MKDKRVTHGLTRLKNRQEPIWRTYCKWSAMKNRCYTLSNKKWHLYGGRGITVCERWKNSFKSFLEDMGPAPEGLSLDRWPDSNGDYEPGNCRWGNHEEQNGNRGEYNVFINYNGEQYCLSRLARRFNLSHQTLRDRLLSGWDLDTALTLKPHKHNRPMLSTCPE